MNANKAPQGEAKAGVPDSELLRLIFESATDFGIFTMDPNGITTSWNTGAKRLFGFEDSDIIGQSADVIFPPEEGGAEAAAEERRLALAHAQGRHALVGVRAAHAIGQCIVRVREDRPRPHKAACRRATAARNRRVVQGVGDEHSPAGLPL